MGSDNFSSTLDSLIGYYVNLYVGEEIIKGKLMGVETDHIVLEDENNYVFYYNIEKIQAITKNTKQFKTTEIKSEFLKTQSLRDLLVSLKNKWVTILCLNKQTFSGVLSIVDSDFVTLINGEERILVKFTHISNILKGYKKEQKSESEKAGKASDKHVKNAKEDKKEIEAIVPVNESKQEIKTVQREKVRKVEKDTTKVIINESEKDKNIWSDSIKTDDKVVVVAAPKPKVDTTTQKMDSKPIESKPQKAEVKTVTNDTKIQKSEVIHKFNHQETTQPSAFIPKEIKAPVKNVQAMLKPAKVETAPQKEVVSKDTQELLSKVKKVKETLETQPLMKIGSKTKRNSVEKNEQTVKPQVQEVGAFKFAGEPVERQTDRRSIFSGWPTRKNMPRRF